MYVKNIMVTDVITTFPDASLSLAFQTLMEKGYSQLPVVKDKKLVGLVTEQVLAEFSPSKATSLSMYEVNYILSKTKVEKVMLKDILTCTPDTLVEDAAIIFNEHQKVNALPVINEKGLLEGILTKSDIIASFINIVGANDKGTRIAVKTVDKPGMIAAIAGIISKLNVNITHMTEYHYQELGDNNFEVVIRVNTLETDELVKQLEDGGYTVLSIKSHE